MENAARPIRHFLQVCVAAHSISRCDAVGVLSVKRASIGAVVLLIYGLLALIQEVVSDRVVHNCASRSTCCSISPQELLVMLCWATNCSVLRHTSTTSLCCEFRRRSYIYVIRVRHVNGRLGSKLILCALPLFAQAAIVWLVRIFRAYCGILMREQLIGYSLPMLVVQVMLHRLVWQLTGVVESPV